MEGSTARRGASAVGVSALITVLLCACGGGSGTTSGTSGKKATRTTTSKATATATTATTPPAPPPKPPPPPYPHLLPSALGSAPTGFTPAAVWQGQTAAWIARQASLAMLAFNQRVVELRLHSGTTDAGAIGWRFGPAIAGAERRHLIAAFNGGFRLPIGAGGFMSYGRVAVPLRQGLGSIVTYSDGSSDIGSWGAEVPASSRTVVSVRQNLTLLIDHGVSASTLSCLTCWGATLGGVTDPARSALGITADGRLVWAGGEHLTVAALADALLGVQVVRAVELDINPEWVAGYLYGHRGGMGPLAPVPIAPGQVGIPGQYLTPWSRDFFTVEGR